MHEIIAGRVWTGNARDAKDISSLLALEIGAVVQLAAEELPNTVAREMIYCRFPIVDGSENSVATLRTAIETVAALIEREVPVLVTCGAGMSRSPAIVAAALSRVHDETPDDWLKRITTSGPHDVSPGLWKEVCDSLRPQ